VNVKPQEDADFSKLNLSTKQQCAEWWHSIARGVISTAHLVAKV